MRAPAQRGGIQDLIQKTSVLEIVGNMIRVRANQAALGDLAEVQNVDGAILTARVVGLDQLAICWLRG
jgi:V/A-type H+-transporting ATPase subunit B